MVSTNNNNSQLRTHFVYQARHAEHIRPPSLRFVCAMASAHLQIMQSWGELGRKMQEIDSEMRAILEAAKSPNAKILLLRNQCMELLLRSGLATPQERIHCRHAGVHQRNRYGDGIVPSKVHQLLHGIFQTSLQTSELDKPTALEMPPAGHPRREILRRFNVNQMLQSAGRLPEYEDQGEHIRALSLTCGHTTQTLRCFFHGVESDHPELSTDGRLDMQLLQKKDRQYHEAALRGIEYTLIRWEVEEIWPEALDLFQEAVNAKNWLLEGESRLQIMLKMHALARSSVQQASSASSASAEDVWADVIASAERGNPPYLAELGDLLYATRHLSGGLDRPRFLESIPEFCRTLETERIVRGSIWKALSAVAVGGSLHSCPKFRIFCGMAPAGASHLYSKGPEQFLLSVSDINSLANSKFAPHVEKAEDMIYQAELYMVEHNCWSNARARVCFFLLRIRLVLHVLLKKDTARGVFVTMNNIGAQYTADLSAILQKPMPSVWGDLPAEPKAKASGSSRCTPAPVAMTEFDATG